MVSLDAVEMIGGYESRSYAVYVRDGDVWRRLMRPPFYPRCRTPRRHQWTSIQAAKQASRKIKRPQFVAGSTFNPVTQ